MWDAYCKEHVSAYFTRPNPGVENRETALNEHGKSNFLKKVDHLDSTSMAYADFMPS